MPAYANGQKYLYNGGPERKAYSDPDASWGHRSALSTRAAGSFYGYKLHQAVCADTGLPLAWRVQLGAVEAGGCGPHQQLALPGCRSCLIGGCG